MGLHYIITRGRWYDYGSPQLLVISVICGMYAVGQAEVLAVVHEIVLMNVGHLVSQDKLMVLLQLSRRCS